MPDFEISIAKQGWISPDDAAEDLCSHGDVRVVIGGQVLAEGDGDGKYGISEAALALLRTLEADHSVDSPVAEHLVPHGCGLILMMGCGIGLDWRVTHRGNRVVLDDIEAFPSLEAELPEEEYRRQVVAFATEAKQLFVGVDKVITDEFDREQYDDFWAEYDRLLEAHSEPAPDG